MPLLSRWFSVRKGCDGGRVPSFLVNGRYPFNNTGVCLDRPMSSFRQSAGAVKVSQGCRRVSLTEKPLYVKGYTPLSQTSQGCLGGCQIKRTEKAKRGESDNINHLVTPRFAQEMFSERKPPLLSVTAVTHPLHPDAVYGKSSQGWSNRPLTDRDETEVFSNV